MSKIEIYTSENCPYCKQIKEHLTEKKIDLDEYYPFDKSGSARLGRCASCNGIVFGNKFTIAKDDSDCCKAKINKYR